MDRQVTSAAMAHLSADDGAASMLDAARRELTARIDRLTAGIEGTLETAISGLSLHRVAQPGRPKPVMQQSAFSVIAQGSKQLLVGDEIYEYDPLHYLVSSVDLPVTGRVAVASPTQPYLGLRLVLEVDDIAALIRDEGLPAMRQAEPSRGLYVHRLNPAMLDAVLRLLALLDAPQDIPILAPMIKREIVYRLLTNGQGAQLQQIALKDSHTHRIARAIREIQRNFSQPLRVEALARDVHMSVSSFHHHFKSVTAHSPLQYQKQLRLQEARRLIWVGNHDVAMVAHQVGYESPSQFSREYSRLFGASPLRDKRRLLEEASSP